MVRLHLGGYSLLKLDGDDGARKESNASQLSLASKKSSKEGSRTCPNCSYFEAELFRLQQELTNTENDVRTELIQVITVFFIGSILYYRPMRRNWKHFSVIMKGLCMSKFKMQRLDFRGKWTFYADRMNKNSILYVTAISNQFYDPHKVRKRLSCVQEQNHSLQSKHEQELVSVYEQHKLELERTVS